MLVIIRLLFQLLGGSYLCLCVKCCYLSGFCVSGVIVCSQVAWSAPRATATVLACIGHLECATELGKSKCCACLCAPRFKTAISFLPAPTGARICFLTMVRASRCAKIRVSKSLLLQQPNKAPVYFAPYWAAFGRACGPDEVPQRFIPILWCAAPSFMSKSRLMARRHSRSWKAP